MQIGRLGFLWTFVYGWRTDNARRMSHAMRVHWLACSSPAAEDEHLLLVIASSAIYSKLRPRYVRVYRCVRAWARGDGLTAEWPIVLNGCTYGRLF